MRQEHKIYAKIVYFEELPLPKQSDKWRAIYTYRYEEGKTVIEITAQDSVAFRAVVNELTRYFVAAEKISKLLDKIL